MFSYSDGDEKKSGAVQIAQGDDFDSLKEALSQICREMFRLHLQEKLDVSLTQGELK